MSKSFPSISIIILGLCILLGSWLISDSLGEQDAPLQSEEEYRYEFISPNDNNIIIFDKETGEYWRRFIDSTAGPTEWESQPSPISQPVEGE
ncbi:hypothetical protein V1502_02145 [Bacillus sp. SCS-153A]|uniref:hypothetical protein n=1 Tax=Rossellomorea sedimentorum TaxID=3115294 RepID=UPI003906CDFD